MDCLSGVDEPTPQTVGSSKVPTSHIPCLRTILRRRCRGRQPLKRDKRQETRFGNIEHNDIIGKRPTEEVYSHNQNYFTVLNPTLDEHIRLSRRKIYPRDADFLVSKLELHPPLPDDKGPPLEILEAGTGHGSLTLHLARAIHGANGSPPESKLQTPEGEAEESPNPILEEWKAHRKAIIHTVDILPKYTCHAQKIVSTFRRGLYTHDIDFHVCPQGVSEWVTTQLSLRHSQHQSQSKQQEPTTSPPFLSHAILDLPSAHLQIPTLYPALLRNSTLAVFMPNITQIIDCCNVIKSHDLNLKRIDTLELGAGCTTPRQWVIQRVIPRAIERAREEVVNADEEVGVESAEGSDSVSGSETAAGASSNPQDSQFQTVCRPKPGVIVGGGGFLGVWRKMED
ncbi:MAG: hypothetical protein M1834_000541 [Cirrosporium novae-zelandiae]|nr:MAG: hypothetical protein M1834_000541 [Cirrosporium novae-zelandiae]